MKNYKIIVTFKNGKVDNLTITEQQAKQYKNIQNYIFTLFNKNNIKRIDVVMHNNITGNEFIETTYDEILEKLKERNNRVEITYKFNSGKEEKTRCYIEKSTGWIPIYLEIKRRNSLGGTGLLTNCISNLRVVY